MAGSKILWKWDDGAKILLIELLNWAKTWWFDLDSVYCVNWKYFVIEFLKFESKFPWMTPFTSHPNKYWFNKQKFISLWDITQKLNWKLFLINYETTDEWKIWDRFKLMEVVSINKEKWLKTIDTNKNLLEMKQWWKVINDASLKQ